MSTGLATEASAGSAAARAARLASPSGSTTRPPASHASVHRIAGPPAFVTMATRLPGGSGWRLSTAATSNISRDRVGTHHARMPEERVDVMSGAASSAPVCEAAARWPAAERPLLTATTGFGRQRCGRCERTSRVSERLEVEDDHVACPRPPPSTEGSRCRTGRPCCRSIRTRTGRCPEPAGGRWAAKTERAALRGEAHPPGGGRRVRRSR